MYVGVWVDGGSSRDLRIASNALAVFSRSRFLTLQNTKKRSTSVSFGYITVSRSVVLTFGCAPATLPAKASPPTRTHEITLHSLSFALPRRLCPCDLCCRPSGGHEVSKKHKFIGEGGEELSSAFTVYSVPCGPLPITPAYLTQRGMPVPRGRVFVQIWAKYVRHAFHDFPFNYC